VRVSQNQSTSMIVTRHNVEIFPRDARARPLEMTKPRGCLRVLTRKLMGLARSGDVEGLRAFVSGDAFLVAFIGLDPNHRRAAMRCFANSADLCEAKARHPLVPPRPIDAKRSQKASWGDVQMRARLAEAYAHAGGDDEQAARLLGVSLGSARLAKKRHLHAQQLISTRSPVAGRRRPFWIEGTLAMAQAQIASVTGWETAFRCRGRRRLPLGDQR